MVEISTSLLNVEEENSVKTFYSLEVAKTDYFHIDVMDGKFVENNTEERIFKYATEVKHISNIPLDVHFMVEDIKGNIERYLPIEPKIITFHLEACKNKEEVKKYIELLQKNGIKCGISIKPATPVEEIYEFLPYMYLCLIMTVEPGKGGQKLIPETVEKVKILKQYIKEKGLDTYIEVDGGINTETAKTVREAGADILVAGKAIITASDHAKIIKELKE